MADNPIIGGVCRIVEGAIEQEVIAVGQSFAQLQLQCPCYALFRCCSAHWSQEKVSSPYTRDRQGCTHDHAELLLMVQLTPSRKSLVTCQR